MAHKWGRFALVWLTVAVVAVTMFFNSIAGTVGVDWGVYTQTMDRNSSDRYFLEFTPAPWTFGIWGFIYTYQIIWLIYGISTLFRSTKSGGYLYFDPPYMSPVVYVAFMFNMGLNVTWLLIFDRDYLWQGLVVLALMTFSLYICIFVSARDLVKYGQELINMGKKREIWLVRCLVHNAWGMYAAWVTIATLLNLGIVLSYVGTVPQHISSTICLGILALEACVYFILDNFVLDKYLRYMVTPYIVLHVALIGSLAEHWNPMKSNSILTVALLILGASLTCVKVGLVTWRHKNKPIFCEAEKKG